MFRWFKLLVITIALGAGAATAAAEAITDLYQVRVPVSSQSERDLGKAARAGLAELMVRVSGDTDAAADPGLQAALANAQRYLEQYRFDRAAPVEGEPPADPWLAVLRFAREPVDQLLRTAGLPVWSSNRPVLMVWLAKDEEGSPTIVSEASHPELVHELREHAQRRGVILRFPLLDLDDLAAISSEDVWRLDGLALEAATARYPVDAVLAGRATEVSGGRWLGSWRLAVGEERWTFDLEQASRNEWLGSGIDRVAAALGDHYAGPATGSEAGTDLALQLRGISGFPAYGEAMRYLQRLEQVRDVRLVEVRGDQLLLTLHAAGGRQHLERLLALDNRLRVDAGPPAADDRLRYRWRSGGG